MCGIAGIINSEKNIKDLEEEIKKMTDIIEHRGPNAKGYYIENNKVAFGHRRLSILDLSNIGNQPMSINDNELVIIFNGEIYNYIEIKQDLQNKGYNFKSNTDTEVILYAYKEWGKNCVNKFNGMWAFAIYDRKNSRIFCSRDRFGVKPFYYKLENNTFYFGSEIKQLIKKENNKVNKEILITYLTTGIEEYDIFNTFFADIKKLPGSYNLTYDLNTNNFTMEKYYDLESKVKKRKKETKELYVEDYKKIFKNSISLRLRSDAKVGVCLSGGLDSSSIATVAGKELFKKSNQKMLAIHAKASEKELAENYYAEIVSKQSNLKLEVIEPTIEEFKQLIDEVIYTQEEPFGSPSIFMQYLVMKKAKELGCFVMLDGQGGDETLLGYERYYCAYLNSLPLLKKILAFNKIRQNNTLSMLTILKYTIGFSNYNIRKLLINKRATKIKKEYKKYINFEIIKKSAKAFKDINKLQILEINNLQMPHLLKYEDKNSMKHSIETRLPFIDYNLVETVLAIDNSIKIKDGWTKYILRKTMEDIMSKEISWRKSKLGFVSPEKTWLNEIKNEIKKSFETSELLNSICMIEKINFSNNDLREIWRYYNVAKWAEIYKVII